MKQHSTSIPEHALEALASCLYPKIHHYFSTSQGKNEFNQWQANHIHQQRRAENEKVE